MKLSNVNCDCPDWADMCKHVAAVLYGVGARLDTDPAVLFTLRAVDLEELIDIQQAVTDITTSTKGKGKRLSQDAASAIFDLDISSETMTQEEKSELNVKQTKQRISTFPKILTGAAVLKRRTELGLTKTAFAKALGINSGLITKWEKQGRKKLAVPESTLLKLQEFWKKSASV